MTFSIMVIVAPTVLTVIFLISLLIIFSRTSLALTDHSVLKSQDFDKHNGITNALVRVSASAFIPHEIKISIVPDAAYVGNKAFSPNPVNIKAGDTITWIDNDVETHTVTSGSGYNDASAGKLFDSGILDYGQGFSHTFNIREEFRYFCQFHPSMTGKVIVK